MTKENLSKYQLRYPHYMPWARRIFVLNVGQVIQGDAGAFSVKQVTRSPIQGEPPRIVLDKLEAND
jgi:hypothetical protein